MIEPLKPVVPIKRSVAFDYIICFEDGIRPEATGSERA
jgi:predicted transcriptional regulator